MTKRPNIIIFNPDQMRWDAMGHMGNPAASTPFLDRFAAEEAVSFRNAYCQNPVCVPSRCSFLTGLYPHVHGHRTMRYLMHGWESSMFSELKAAGYHVWMNDRNDLLAGQEPHISEAHADEVFSGGAVTSPPGPENPDWRGKPGDKSYYSFYQGRLAQDENGRNYSADDAAVDAAIDRILHPADDKPLCIFLGLFFPHPPYGVEEPYFSMIDRKKLPRRAGIGEGKSAMEAKLRECMAMDGYTEEEWDELRACYLGMCRKVDDQFARLCAALKEAGIYDDSAIFFLSDHGDYTGDYGLPEKAQNTFEDCLTRVPLLIKPPKGVDVDPGVADGMAELVDFYATAMDFAGVEPDHDQFGVSLRPVIADRSRAGRPFVFSEGGRMPYEYQSDEYHANAGPDGIVPKNSPYWPRQTSQADGRAHVKGTMIRDSRYKYVHRIDGTHEFYDLEKDPREEKNVYGDPAYENQVARMRMEILNWYQKTCDVVPRQFDSRWLPGPLWEKFEKLCPPEHADELREMIYKDPIPFNVMRKLNEWKRG